MEAIRFDPYCEDCVYLREKPEACCGCQYWLEQQLGAAACALNKIANYQYDLKGGHYEAYRRMKHIAKKAVEELDMLYPTRGGDA